MNSNSKALNQEINQALKSIAEQTALLTYLKSENNHLSITSAIVIRDALKVAAAALASATSSAAKLAELDNASPTPTATPEQLAHLRIDPVSGK